MKNILAICTHSPYGGNLAKEGLDAILAAGVYEQNLSMILLDEGVFQLLPNQRSDQIHQKNIPQILNALTLFGIDNIYVEQESLIERGLDVNNLSLENISLIKRSALPMLFAQQQQILSF